MAGVMTTKPALLAQRGRLPPWLIYRWLSLLPAVWLLILSDGGISPLLWLAAALILTFLVTFLYQRLPLLKGPLFLNIEAVLMALLLTLTGAGHSPYLLHALSPLLAGAVFLALPAALLPAASFTLAYMVMLRLGGQSETPGVELALLQIAGAWLLTWLFAHTGSRLRQLQEIQQALVAEREKLRQQNAGLARQNRTLSEQVAELTAAHHQLEIIHDMTMLLQGATDIPAIERRILRAVAAEVPCAQALIGLVNPATNRLDRWQVYPDNPQLLSAIDPLPLIPESGFLLQELLNRRGGWWLEGPPLVADELLNEWFSQMPWLILPLLLKDQLTGVLLIAVEGGPDALSEEQLVVLSAIAGQAALALSSLERVKQLTIAQERNRIARDIHDTVTQSLFGIVFTLDACIKMLPRQTELVQQELVELRNLAERVRQEVRQSIHNLWPPELTLEGFKADLTKYVNHCSVSGDFQVEFTIGGDFEGLPLAIRRDLYRVAQEALANVARHAQVHTARVSLYVEPHEVQLSIRDHGKGFDPKATLAQAESRERFGLRGIQERIFARHGHCEILSQAEQGTQILVRLPTLQGDNHEPQ